MDGVRGVGGVPEPAPERPVDVRAKREDETPDLRVKDGVQISSAAQRAATVSHLLELAREQPDIREDRVAAARESIARGDYKREDVVARVAERIAGMLSE